MPIIRNLQGTGISPLAASAIVGTIADGLTATGTTQATAYLVSTDTSVFSTVAANTGCRLPMGGENDQYLIINDGANSLKIYPPNGGTINGGAADAPYVLSASTNVSVYYQDYLTIRIRQGDGVTATDLASTASNKGAGLVGFLYAAVYGANTVGKWLQDLATSAGASFIGWIQSGTGAVTRTLQAKVQEIQVTPQDFGAVANNTADDYAAFAAWITYCQTNRKRGHIPDGNYLLGTQLAITAPFDITSDRTARLRWNNSGSCGISIDFSSASTGLCEMNLPQLYSPAIDSTHSIPGYGPSTYTYDLTSRTGAAIKVKGGDRTTINLHTAVGWTDAIKIEPTTARSSNNTNINVNTIDFCTYGAHIYGGANASYGVNSFSFIANTVWAKFPVYLDPSAGFITSSKIAITGQAFTNETGGCGVYGAGTRTDTVKVDINWLYAGYGADSTSSVSTSLECPFIGGDQTSNGTSTDGNCTDVGYFGGKFCEFRIGSVMGLPGGKGAGSVPAAGDVIRVRDAGQYNLITVGFSNSVATSPISTTTTAGEANFNGGIGGAQYSKYVYCQATLPALTAYTGTVNHYIYHQCLSPASVKPINVFNRNSGLIDQGIIMHARDTSSTENRRITLTFKNVTANTTTAATYQFWIEVP